MCLEVAGVSYAFLQEELTHIYPKYLSWPRASLQLSEIPNLAPHIGQETGPHG